MEMLKAAVCNELRNELTKYLYLQTIDTTPYAQMEKSRRKIESLGAQLDTLQEVK